MLLTWKKSAVIQSDVSGRAAAGGKLEFENSWVNRFRPNPPTSKLAAPVASGNRSKIALQRQPAASRRSKFDENLYPGPLNFRSRAASDLKNQVLVRGMT